MARRRAAARRVKRHFTYTVEEAARVTGHHVQTLRRWIQSGSLPAVCDRRPHLIPGQVLFDFLIAPSRWQVKLGPGELFCLGCRAARKPAADMTELRKARNSTAMLAGICPVCTSLMHRRIAAPVSVLPALTREDAPNGGSDT